MKKKPTLGTKKNPIKIKLKKGGTAEDLAAKVKKHHKTIEALHAVPKDANIVVQPGKNIGSGHP
jgi:hypothetical protein